MKTVVIFTLVVLATLSAGVPLPRAESDQLNREDKERTDAAIQEALKGCDAITVSVAKLRPLLEGAHRSAVITDPAAIASVASTLRAKQRESDWIKEAGIDGAILPLVNCQCWGDFEFSFSKKGEVLATIVVLHWTNFRSEQLTGGSDFPLESSALEQLYGLAARALPSYRVEKPNRQSQCRQRGMAPPRGRDLEANHELAAVPRAKDAKFAMAITSLGVRCDLGARILK